MGSTNFENEYGEGGFVSGGGGGGGGERTLFIISLDRIDDFIYTVVPLSKNLLSNIKIKTIMI